MTDRRILLGELRLLLWLWVGQFGHTLFMAALSRGAFNGRGKDGKVYDAGLPLCRLAVVEAEIQSQKVRAR